MQAIRPTGNTFRRASCEYRYVRFERQTVPLYVLILVYQYDIRDCSGRPGLRNFKAQSLILCASTSKFPIFALSYISRLIYFIMYREITSHVKGCTGQPQPKMTSINIIRLLCCGGNTLSSPINDSMWDVVGPAEVAAATTYYTHHELRRKTML